MSLIPSARKLLWQQFRVDCRYVDPPPFGQISTVDKMADVASFRCWVRLPYYGIILYLTSLVASERIFPTFISL